MHFFLESLHHTQATSDLVFLLDFIGPHVSRNKTQFTITITHTLFADCSNHLPICNICTILPDCARAWLQLKAPVAWAPRSSQPAPVTVVQSTLPTRSRTRSLGCRLGGGGLEESHSGKGPSRSNRLRLCLQAVRTAALVLAQTTLLPRSSST